MTFSTDEEVQRSYESSYRNNAALLNVPATTICTKSAIVQNDRKGNQNISVLDHLSNNDMAVLASPVVTGSQSLAVPDSYIEQTLINYMSNEAHNELAHVYGVNYNNLSQSQIAQNLQPTRSNWSLESENNVIEEQGVNSGSKTLCDNTFLNTIHSNGNYSRCIATTSSVDQSIPMNSNEVELSITRLCGEVDHSNEENALNQVEDEPTEDIEFICETRGTIASTRKHDQNASSSSVVTSTADRSLFHAMTSFDPKVKLLVNEHCTRMENFLIGAYKLLKALPEGGAAIAHLNSENQSLKKKVSDMGRCLNFMEKKFNDHLKQSAERGFNAAKVVKCFNNKSIKMCSDKCDAAYHEYKLKMKETEESLEKQYNEKLQSYEKLVQSLEDDKLRLELQNDKLLEEIENLKICKKALELQNKKLSEEFENHKAKERLKWEQQKNEEVMEAKRADWCNVCLKPAFIHCCWNTNYCSDDCRQKHYKKHSRDCSNVESKKAPSTLTTSVENCQDFTHSSNIQRSVTLMSSSSHHTSVVQVRESTVATNSVTVPHEPTSSFMQGRNYSPL
ncbi:Protein kinase C-binding protein 1, partial [Stegodyphus mimosarum]